MLVTDPIADMLTRIRNALVARHTTVDIPSSKIKKAIAQILLDEGYIKGFEFVKDGAFENIRITLKYGQGKQNVVVGLKRISKPGLRVYVQHEDLPRVLGGLGIALISTSQGIMTDKKARKLNIGGEVLAYIW